MTNITIYLDLLLLFSLNTTSTDFNLVMPNNEKIQEQLLESDYQEEAIYYYLINNFKTVSEIYATQFFEWDTNTLCTYTQDFENSIQYSIYECGESGSNLKVTFPKMQKENLMKWVEKIHAVYEMEENSNVWKEKNTRYEPEFLEPGCYYEILETENSMSVQIYCGC
ncbi:MAG: hypothetical protein HRT68_09395 [Flavobacteriaceae bacterium]|nr:hypothetical protein [Flavobacteriaceae bacterium]